jgi:hypothetical protein
LRNRSLFERRWRAQLAHYPLAPLFGQRRLIAARDIRSSDRVLVLGEPGLAEVIASTFPSARVTLAGIEEEAPDLDFGIEFADDTERVCANGGPTTTWSSESRPRSSASTSFNC